jgi:hypothetical protein
VLNRRSPKLEKSINMPKTITNGAITTTIADTAEIPVGYEVVVTKKPETAKGAGTKGAKEAKDAEAGTKPADRAGKTEEEAKKPETAKGAGGDK